MSQFYYKITICPDPTHFPDGLSSEILASIVSFFSDKEEALLSTEHHKSGVIHYEGLFGVMKEVRVSHIKRELFILCGFPARTQISMDPNMRKHMIVIKAVNYLPGAVNYVMKEGKGDLVKKGMSATWLSEQILEAVKNKQLLDADNVIFVNDSTFVKEVTRFVVDNNESWSNLQDVLVRMNRTHDFCRVRNGKAHVAHLMLKHNDDSSTAVDLVSQWFSVGYR